MMARYPETTAADVAEMLRHVPSRPDYETWIRVASAVFSVLSLDEGCAVLEAWSPEEKPGEYAQVYKTGMKQVGIGSLVNLAKQHGYNPAARLRDRPQWHSFAQKPRFLPRNVKTDTMTAARVFPGEIGASSCPKCIHKTDTKTLRLPEDLRVGSIAELKQVENLRHLPCFAGLQIASDRGLLRFGSVWDAGESCPAWLLTDTAGKVAQARRMDGKGWAGIGGAKAKTLPGSASGWPVGAAALEGKDVVFFVAGGPDMLAALTLLWWADAPMERLAVVAMMGEQTRILPEALPLFQGKHVRLIYDQDKAGEDACRRKIRELSGAGAEVFAFDLSAFLPANGKDLNDCITPDADEPFPAQLTNQLLKGIQK